MSENITHTAICDDGRRLSPYLGLPEAMVTAWETHRDVSRIGALTRWTDEISPYLIRHAADQAGGRDPNAAQKLAFACGALTHRSIDRHMKPVFRSFGDGSTDARTRVDRQGKNKAGNWCTIWCDVFILKEVFANGADGAELGPEQLRADNPYPRNFLSPESAGVPFEEAVRASWQRTMLRMHTFKPLKEEPTVWLDDLLQRMQDFNLDLRRYEKVWGEWETNDDDRHKYLVGTNFYDRNDPLLATVTRLRRGEPGDAHEIAAALEETHDDSSRYARALKRATEYLRAAGRLYAGEIDIPTAAPLMDIGVPELAMGYQQTPTQAS